MSYFPKLLLVVGAVLTSVGSFLPWIVLAIVAYQWISFVLNKLNWGSIIGAPEPLIGLDIIALGAMLVLVAAIWNYRVRSETVEL